MYGHVLGSNMVGLGCWTSTRHLFRLRNDTLEKKKVPPMPPAPPEVLEWCSSELELLFLVWCSSCTEFNSLSGQTCENAPTPRPCRHRTSPRENNPRAHFCNAMIDLFFDTAFMAVFKRNQPITGFGAKAKLDQVAHTSS